MWVLYNFAERIGDDYPIREYRLGKSLHASLAKAKKIFNHYDFYIIINNVGLSLKEIDFKVIRLEDHNIVGKIKFDEINFR